VKSRYINLLLTLTLTLPFLSDNWDVLTLFLGGSRRPGWDGLAGYVHHRVKFDSCGWDVWSRGRSRGGYDPRYLLQAG